MGRSVIVFVAAVLAAVVSAAPPRVTAQTPAAPLLILISIDGFRWDYFDRAPLPNLQALAARGVRSQGLILAFPTVTFPNHFTIVTGLWPDHHGVIANAMVDPRIGPQKFTMASATARDPRWWGGEPIWRTVMKRGWKSAAMFWPGSEAVKPTYWRPFDDNVSNADRVTQALQWLRLPEGERPAFSTVYFSEVDHAGHEFGPNGAEVLTAAAHVDEALGSLIRGVDALGLADRTTYVVVSDHGMAPTSGNRIIYLDDYLKPEDIDVADWSSNVAINPSPRSSPDEIYRTLVNRHPALAVYRRGRFPAWLRYGSNVRVPEVVGVAEVGWTVTSHAAEEARQANGRRFNRGAHGYDPRYRELHGLIQALNEIHRQIDQRPGVKKNRVRKFTALQIFKNVAGNKLHILNARKTVFIK